MLNQLVLALGILGACIATAAIIPLLKVAALMRTDGLRRAWWSLTIIILCCIGLLLVAAVESLKEGANAYVLVATGIHVLGPIFVLSVAWLSYRTAHDMLRIEALEAAAFVDPLTGLSNRRCFDERLAHEVQRTRAIGLPLSLLVLDIDHFKRVNDAHGHDVGDLVLKHVATLIAARIRIPDTACRVGGEEFVVIVPGLEGVFVEAAAERLRHAISETGITLESGNEVRATVSLGLATLLPGETAALLFRRADAALYAAKRGGRDQVSLAA